MQRYPLRGPQEELPAQRNDRDGEEINQDGDNQQRQMKLPQVVQELLGAQTPKRKKQKRGADKQTDADRNALAAAVHSHPVHASLVSGNALCRRIAERVLPLNRSDSKRQSVQCLPRRRIV